MGTLNSFELDLDKQRFGVWRPFLEDIELLIGRVGSSAYDQRLHELLVALGPGPVDAKGLRAAVNQVLSEMALLGWRNLQETPGGPSVPYSQAKALELLGEPRYELLRQFVVREGANFDLFRHVVEGVQGNSSSTSGSASPGGETQPS